VVAVVRAEIFALPRPFAHSPTPLPGSFHTLKLEDEDDDENDYEGL
jgi:hypothetical protein